MNAFDPRLTPARPELAAKHLEGKISAARYVDGVEREVVDAQAPLRRDPSPVAPMLTEALKGERVIVYETDDEGWSWGQLQSDGYVGWMPASALMQPGPAPTHRVNALRTLTFPGPDIKLPPAEMPPLGAKVSVMRSDRRFAVTPSGYIPANHLSPLGSHETDFVAVAERFVDVPYLWGGKTNFGLDCSGLLQTVLSACGISSLRDSDMQERSLGAPIQYASDFSDLRRGDLIFWRGHVAIVRNGTTLIHANAFHMAVVIEPIAEAVARIRAIGSEVTNVRRLQAGPP